MKEIKQKPAGGKPKTADAARVPKAVVKAAWLQAREAAQTGGEAAQRHGAGETIAHAQLQEIISLWHKIPGEARGSAYVMIKGMLIAAQQLPQK